MAVRVRVNISVGDKSLEAVALINSGFETEEPQILIPMKALRKLGLKLTGAVEDIYDTAGGPTRVWIYPEKARISIVEKGKVVSEAIADIVISAIEDEVLIGDKLAGALKIMVEDFTEGIWRIKGGRRRRSEKPQRWR